VARDPVIADLAAEQGELTALLESLGESDWARPAQRCPGWDVADVVLHLAQTTEVAVASLDGTFTEVAGMFAGGRGATTIDEVVDDWVAADRGESPARLLGRWRRGTTALLASFDATDLRRRFPWATGELAARTLASTRLAETWIHAGDVADAMGVTQQPTDRLRHIARLAWRSLPYAFARGGRAMHGAVAAALRGPGGDTWSFEPDEPAATTITGDAGDWCLVAARRRDAASTTLRGEGPDASDVLALVRTYA
jgi:uncharacterized protein (TIGR03084 family)